MRKRGIDQLQGNRAADQCLCFRYIDRTMPLLPNPEISSLLPSSMAVQPSLCRTLSEPLKTDILMMMLKLLKIVHYEKK